jgi:predicted negative regulator of RcsB-dependent stress response
MQYASFQQTVSQGDLAQMLAQSKRLREDDADSAYAVFAALTTAKQALAADPADSDAAEQELRWVAEHANVDGLQQIGRLRLARVLLAKGDTDGAQAQLKGSNPGGAFAALYAEIEGDIAVASGEPQRAREAYTLALAGQGNAPMLRIKLENLGVNPDS